MVQQKNNGLLITVEGIDGSGKSSITASLYDYLKQNYPVLLTKEPGATELGKRLRTLLQERTFDLTGQAEYLLFAADRAQHMNELVLPALAQGKIVLSDRMADSSLAYQGYGRGLDKQWIKNINTWAMADKSPDLTIYLRIDYETAHERLQQRNEVPTVFEQEKAAFFNRVITDFDEILSRPNVLIIDASQPKEQVSKEVIERVSAFLKESRGV